METEFRVLLILSFLLLTPYAAFPKTVDLTQMPKLAGSYTLDPTEPTPSCPRHLAVEIWQGSSTSLKITFDPSATWKTEQTFYDVNGKASCNTPGAWIDWDGECECFKTEAWKSGNFVLVANKVRSCNFWENWEVSYGEKPAAFSDDGSLQLRPLLLDHSHDGLCHYTRDSDTIKTPEVAARRDMEL